MTVDNPAEGSAEAGAPPMRHPRWWRRHKALTVLLTVALVLVLAVGGWVFYLNRQISDIPRFQVDTGDSDRPVRVADGGENLLLLGTDDPDGGGGVFELLESGDWQPGRFRSDAIMVLHLNRDRDAAQLISIPRDSYVPIADHGRSKINAAFSWGGPNLMVRTVEDLTGVRIDHTVVIDFAHFKQLTDAVGGVDLNMPSDTEEGEYTWERGRNHLDGEAALTYVRARKQLPRGDFDRVQRQQNFMRALMQKLASTRTLANPARLTRVVTELADTVATDDSLTNGRMRSLALSSRGLRPGDIRFVTVPYQGTDNVPGAGSIVRVERKQIRTMFEFVASDNFESWYADHEVDELPGAADVN